MGRSRGESWAHVARECLACVILTYTLRCGYTVVQYIFFFLLSLSRVPVEGYENVCMMGSLMAVAQCMLLVVCYGSHARDCKTVVRERGSN